MTDEELYPDPVFVLEGHEKAVCAVSFAPRLQDRILSSAKDGTARIWQNGDCLAVLKCDISDPKVPPPARTPQVLVRGCAFGDLDGQVVYTIASGRRGKAYLSHWEEIPVADEKQPVEYELVMRTECSPCPISAMSLSGDASLLAMGSVDGTIILWSIEQWRALKRFTEVHDLPVTCIAAR
jgi:WD40 repeat protein